MIISRRNFVKNSGFSLGTLVVAGTVAYSKESGGDLHPAIRQLNPMTDGIVPISIAERQQRIQNARRLMAENKIDAIFIEPGSSLIYFANLSWWRSERILGLFIFANGNLVYICPEFEKNRLIESMKIEGDIITWQEHESPFEKTAEYIKSQGVKVRQLGLEETVRFFIADGLASALPHTKIISADPVVIGCRVIKSLAEIALMQRANDITVQAYKAGINSLEEEITQNEFAANVSAAFTALGVKGSVFAQFGQYSAFPHGSRKTQSLYEGDIILMDGGCSIEGYRSDISRTIVFGKPTARQNEVWDIVRRAQDAALKAARPGNTCESVDLAARAVIEAAGFGPGYRYFSHRVGHGIGLEGHECIHLVQGNKTKLAPGMCFSNEPGIYIEGEFGVRLEDCMYITNDGAKLFSAQSPSISQPFA